MGSRLDGCANMVMWGLKSGDVLLVRFSRPSVRYRMPAHRHRMLATVLQSRWRDRYTHVYATEGDAQCRCWLEGAN
jgi:hypothetical protein